MSQIHEGLEDVGFHSCDGLKDVTVCADSGLLATEACSADFRGSRVRTVKVAADTAPTQSCSVHKMVSYCKDGKHLATSSCPSSSVMQVAALDYPRESVFNIKAPDDMYLLSVLSSGECPVHGGTVPTPDDSNVVPDDPADDPVVPDTPDAPVEPDTPDENDEPDIVEDEEDNEDRVMFFQGQ